MSSFWIRLVTEVDCVVQAHWKHTAALAEGASDGAGKNGLKKGHDMTSTKGTWEGRLRNLVAFRAAADYKLDLKLFSYLRQKIFLKHFEVNKFLWVQYK